MPCWRPVGGRYCAHGQIIVEWPHPQDELSDVPANVDHDAIANGINWVLVGEEVIGFRQIVVAGSLWILRGLYRGLRGTRSRIGRVGVGDQVVWLTAMFNGAGITYEPFGGNAAGGQNVYHRVVPGGASVASGTTITTEVRGRAAVPAEPVLRQGMVTIKAGAGITVTWGRRALEQGTVFGPAPLQGGNYERYEVHFYDHAALAAASGGDPDVADSLRHTYTRRIITVGDPSMNTPLSQRSVSYTNTQIAADGFTVGSSAIGVAVFQINAAGASIPAILPSPVTAQS